jgi:Asp-tRNA(Asn)/Glu-tRNA(Gln) amidotransferase A subunit family amidase
MSEDERKALLELDATGLRARLAAREISVTDVAKACLARVTERDAEVEAWAWLDPDAVLGMARDLDGQPEQGPLHGIPIGVKDVFQTRDMPTAYGSPLYAGHRPALDAAAGSWRVDLR